MHSEVNIATFVIRVPGRGEYINICSCSQKKVDMKELKSSRSKRKKGYSSTIKATLVPPMPKELTAALLFAPFVDGESQLLR